MQLGQRVAGRVVFGPYRDEDESTKNLSSIPTKKMEDEKIENGTLSTGRPREQEARTLFSLFKKG